MGKRLVPALGLFLLAPMTGEFLLGNISIRDVAALLFLAPMYGGGALLIRELTRRTGRGWPTILLLGCAYGLVEAGMFDGSLFNPSFEGLDFTATYVSALGISATNTLHFVVGHAVWSIAVPIALVEALVPERRTTPWLGIPGLVVTAVVYLLGGFLVWNWSTQSGNYMTSPAQLAGTVLVAVVLVVIAFRLGRTPAGNVPRPVPRPLAVGVGAFVASSLFSLMPETWPGVALSVVLLLATAAVIVRLSRRADWDDRHRLALAGGVLPTYMWLAFVVASLKGQTDPLSLAGNVVFAVVTVGILVVAMRRTATARSRLATPV
jgi:drug/metabolite transporter superfamily protein YnfA